jgi:hypothetical protein
MTPERHLRAVRQPPPPQLIEAGDGGMRETPELRIESSAESAPITLLRLGSHDLEAGARALTAGSRPSALITGIGEGKETSARARRHAAETEVPWLVDPLLFRTGLEGYRTAPHLQTLDYTPGRDADPYRPSEFGDEELGRRIARGVIGTQMDLGASGALSGAFAIDDVEDPWLAVNRRLLRIGAGAAGAWAAPLIGVLPIRMGGFDDPARQAILARALTNRPPTAWLLMADGLSESSSTARIVSALRLALLLQATGTPVILGRCGDLRRLFLAFGVAGVEFGLGRMLRFAIPDFTKASRGPGPVHGPRIELPSLCCSLPYERAGLLLGQELIAESECACAACMRGISPAARPEAAAEHDGHVVLSSTAALAGRSAPERVEAYESELISAVREWRRVGLAGGDLGRENRAESQLRVLRVAVESGLLEPARVAEELSLLD